MNKYLKNILIFIGIVVGAGIVLFVIAAPMLMATAQLGEFHYIPFTLQYIVEWWGSILIIITILFLYLYAVKLQK